MDTTKNTASNSRLGFASVLTIVFVTLKLCNIINWPWIWVLAPLWIAVANLLNHLKNR